MGGKLCLSPRGRRWGLCVTYAITEPVSEVNFVYVDVNGNIKIHLLEQKEGKHRVPFNSIDSLHNIFRIFD